MRTVDAKKLDDKGRCCGRKPRVYKRDKLRFCVKCDAAFDIETGAQISNWAYRQIGDHKFYDVYSGQREANLPDPPLEDA